MLQLLLDENMSPAYRLQLIRRHPDVTVWRVGDPGAPPVGTLDPEILSWCERHHFVLVTENRSSMPFHLKTHLAQGSHVPGILVLKPRMPMGSVLDELDLILEAGVDEDWLDRLAYLPL